jgi:glutaminase
LNFGRVHQIDVVSVLLLLETFQILSKNKIQVFITHSQQLHLLERAARKEYGEKPPKLLFWEDDEDLALEACENHLIEHFSRRRRSNIAVPLSQCDLSLGLTPAEQKMLRSLLRTVHYSKNQVVLKAGEAGAELLIITRGKVSVWMTGANGRKKRLTTCTPGRIIGEISLLNRAPRSANVTADTDVEALCLPIEGFDALAITEPHLYAKIVTNIARNISHRLNDSNAQFLRAQA